MSKQRGGGAAPRACRRQRHAQPACLSRRCLRRRGDGAAGGSVTPARAEPLAVPRWMKELGAALSAYGQPSRFESKVVRSLPPPPNPATQGIGVARTPLQLLDGTITPNGLHFDRSHSGTPDIDPDQHRLLIHGLVKRPLLFTLEALARYPMESRIAFIEMPAIPRAQQRAGAAGQRPGDPRPALVRGMDRRAACHAARGSRRRGGRTMGGGRRRRRRRDEPQRPAREVHG